MRWITFSAPDAPFAYGILEGSRIREVRGTPFGAHDITNRVHRLEDVKVEVPFVPRTFYAAGLKYVRHVREPISAAKPSTFRRERRSSIAR
ncbi:MAG TPA: DUF2437 domain-containing protein [Burkholderiaceae bacterium]|nr:DUF2437 domain-containing protein [Burkholderiaceae bacterium]